MEKRLSLDSEIKKWKDLKQLFEIAKGTPSIKMWGEEGLWEVICACSRLGISLERGLNGLYKVPKPPSRDAFKGAGAPPTKPKEEEFALEMSVHLMSSLIRSKGHSLSKDPKSNDTLCILHGKRADNQSTWHASFSLADAKRAGLLDKKGYMWVKYPQRMLYARALAILARELFSDVIEGMYVEGELSGENMAADKEEITIESAPSVEAFTVPPSYPEGDERYEEICERVSAQVWELLDAFPDVKESVKKGIELKNLDPSRLPFRVVAHISKRTAIPLETLLTFPETPHNPGEDHVL